MSGLLVQKYGVSVRDARGMRNVCRLVRRSLDGGRRVVVVISAMGHDTDGLEALAFRMKGSLPRPAPRELDLLLATGETTAAPLVAIGLQGMGVPAVALTGMQAGIRTDAEFGRARILDVQPARVLRALDDDTVPVIAGFQGATAELDVTTLGRAGGDTTAVRLAAALHAEVCEIYTGVPGIWTADPHVVPEAAVLEYISYEEALELAAMGLPVSQPRAVEMAGQCGVPIHFRPLDGQGRGTMIVREVPVEHRKHVCAVAHQDGVAMVRLTGLPNRPGGAAHPLEPLRVQGISVEVIQHVAGGDLTFVVRESDLERTLEVVGPPAGAVGASVSHADGLAKVSVVGIAMPERTGVAATMFRTLAGGGVNIEMIATSEIRITCIVRRDGHERAVRALHSAFGLGRA